MKKKQTTQNLITLVLIILTAAKITISWQTGFKIWDFPILAVAILIIFIRVFESMPLGQETDTYRLESLDPTNKSKDDNSPSSLR